MLLPIPSMAVSPPPCPPAHRSRPFLKAVLVLDDWLGKKHEVKSSTAKEEAEVAAQGAEAAVVELVAAVNSIAANGVAAVLETQLPVPAEQEQAFQAAEATPTDEKQQEEEGPEAAAMTATEDGTAPLLANETLTKPAAAAPKAASVSMPAVAAAAVSSLQATTAQLKASKGLAGRGPSRILFALFPQLGVSST